MPPGSASSCARLSQEYRRVVRVRDQQVEVVEAAALDEILKGQ